MTFYIRHYHVDVSQLREGVMIADLQFEQVYTNRLEAWHKLQEVLRISKASGIQILTAPQAPPQGDAYIMHFPGSHLTHMIALEPEVARA